MTKRKIKAVDIFCGAGGLTKGLIDAGISVSLGIDLDPACKHPFERNNRGVKYMLADVDKVKVAAIKKAWRGAKVKVLAGCAPCQPFSTYTARPEAGRRWSMEFVESFWPPCRRNQASHRNDGKRRKSCAPSYF